MNDFIGVVIHESHKMLGISCIHCTACACHHPGELAKPCQLIFMRGYKGDK